MRLGRRRPAPGSRARAFRAPSRAARAAAPRRRARGTRRALDATRPAPAPPARKRPRRAAKRRRGTRRGAPLWTSSSSRESSARRSWSRRRPRHRSSPPGRVARRSPRGAHQGELSPRTTTQRQAAEHRASGDTSLSFRLPSARRWNHFRSLAFKIDRHRTRPCSRCRTGTLLRRRLRWHLRRRAANSCADRGGFVPRAVAIRPRPRPGEKSPHSAFDCCRRERTRPLAAHVVDSTPCCAWDDVSRLQSGSARWASLEPSSH